MLQWLQRSPPAVLCRRGPRWAPSSTLKSSLVILPLRSASYLHTQRGFQCHILRVPAAPPRARTRCGPSLFSALPSER